MLSSFMTYRAVFPKLLGCREALARTPLRGKEGEASNVIPRIKLPLVIEEISFY